MRAGAPGVLVLARTRSLSTRCAGIAPGFGASLDRDPSDCDQLFGGRRGSLRLSPRVRLERGEIGEPVRVARGDIVQVELRGL